MSDELWTPTEIGERLRTERRRLGLSQDAFAAAGGIRRTTLYQYERGDRRPSLDFLIKCTSVGLDLAYMMFGERDFRLGSEIQLEAAELARISALVDIYARDSRGRLLAHEHQQELLSQLCKIASNQSEEHVDWEEIEEVARSFAA